MAVPKTSNYYYQFLEGMISSSTTDLVWILNVASFKSTVDNTRRSF
jgi:hypothetical protein